MKHLITKNKEILFGFLESKKRNYIIVSQVITAFLGLVYGKLVAIYIIPEQLGLYNLQFGIFTLLFTICFSPIVQYYKSSITNLNKKVGWEYYIYTFLVSTILMISLLSIIVGFDLVSFNIEMIIFLAFIPINLFFKLFSDYNNVVDNYIKFVSGNLLKTLLTALLLLALVNINVLEKYEQSNILWIVQIISTIIGLLFLFNKQAIVFKSKRFFSYRTFFKANIEYGLPLMLTAVLSWIVNFADRYVINYYLGANQVGIYNANYALGAKFFLLLSPLFLILLTPKVYSNIKIQNKKLEIIKYARVFYVISIPILVLVYFLKEFIGLFLLSEQYSSGFFVIFWIALAHVFLVVLQLYETLFYSEKETKFIFIGNLFAALSNLVLNFALIPTYGIYGAALSTLIAFCFRFFYVFYKFKKL